jgi:hypothetical protein
MKKNQVMQFVNLLRLFSDKISDPKAFLSIKLVLISGKNKYPVPVVIKTDNDRLFFHIQLIGKKIVIGPEEFIETIGQQASLYDGIELSFFERGGGKKIIADDRNVRVSSIDPLTDSADSHDSLDCMHPLHGVSETRDYYIRTDEANAVLRAIGILDEKSKIRNDKIRKYNQIDRFVELADPLIQEFIQRKEPIRVLDCACGKSYLSFVLNYYIREKCGHSCEFLGLDWSGAVIDSSRSLAEKLHYDNMTFEQCDLLAYTPSRFKPAICMSLHACDTATDLAIYTGIRSGSAAILCVPCCQKELQNSDYSIPEFNHNILSHGLLKARFSDLMTDAMRILLMEANGYETSVIEYISPLDSPKNIMIKGRYTGKINQKSYEEYEHLKKSYGCSITLGKLLEGIR